jgi:putative transposase
MCRTLGVSSSGYHAWVKRPPSSRAVTDAELTEKICAAHTASKGTYGVPRIQFDLTEAGIRVGRKRVARLMRAAGLAGVSRRKFVTTTVRDGGRQAPDLVDRKFVAERQNMLWVADITYIPTWAGFLYLAVVLDVFSRRIVGWSMATTLHTQVVLDALSMALWQRRAKDVIHHSDQGSQYTSIEFGKRCREAGVRPSMGSVGDAYDNAMAESFFATLECELLDRRRFRTQAEARMAVFEFIEGFYNPRRRHSALGYLSPVEFERQQTEGPSIPAHTILPPCSEPSRYGLEMSQWEASSARRPTLTAPARDGLTFVRAGTEEWLRSGPNIRIDRTRRTRCRHPSYPDPKTEALHETGGSPRGHLFVATLESWPEIDSRSEFATEIVTHPASQGVVDDDL